MIGRICCCLRLLWNLLKGFIEKTTYANKITQALGFVIDRFSAYELYMVRLTDVIIL